MIDAETRKLVRRVKIGGNPYNLAFTPDGRYLLVLDWASDTSNDEVIFYDLKEQKIDGRVEVSTWPAHAIFSRDGKLVYVSGETAGDVTVIDVAQRKVVGRVIHGGGDAMGLALAGGRQDSSTPPRARTRRSSRSTRPRTRPSARSRCPGSCTKPTLTLDGKFLYITLRKSNKIVVVRVSDDKVVTVIPQRAYPDLVTMEPTGRYALVTNRYADLVSVIDLSTQTQVRTIPVGKAPHGMALRPR